MRSVAPSQPVAAAQPAVSAGWAVEELSQQIAKARHDLCNPLSHIMGFSEMLVEQAGRQGHGQLQGELQSIFKQADEMVAEITHGLDGQKIAAGLGNVPALQQQVGQFAGHVVEAVERLSRQSPQLSEGEFRSDLARIASAARQLRDLAPAALAHLCKPALFHSTRSERALEQESPSRLPSSPDTGFSPATPKEGSILVVDDMEENRELLHRRLCRLGYSVRLVEDGRRALSFVASNPVDLILLDILMPGLDGVETLTRLKADPATRQIPVIMLSLADELDTVVRCLELGAEDFLPKTFQAAVLMARIESSLTKKRLRDQEQAMLQKLKLEREVSERLLLNILPKPIAERLKRGEKIIADGHAQATVLFTDFVGFTRLCAGLPANDLVSALNEIFSAFDDLCDRYGLEKIKTIGDGYMAVSGLPVPRADHAEAAADLALAMQQHVAQFTSSKAMRFRMRIGLNTGPVVAGVIGTKKFAYDLWGDTVNTARRMEEHAPIGGILTAGATFKCLQRRYAFREARRITVKGKGKMLTYVLLQPLGSERKRVADTDRDDDRPAGL